MFFSFLVPLTNTYLIDVDVQPETQIYVLHTAGCISWKDVGAIAFFGGK